MNRHLEICNSDCVAHGGSYRPAADEMGFCRNRPGSPGVLGRYPTPPPAPTWRPELSARTVLTPDLLSDKTPCRATANTPSIVPRLDIILAGSTDTVKSRSNERLPLGVEEAVARRFVQIALANLVWL